MYFDEYQKEVGFDILSDNSGKYLVSFYWTIVTIINVGYGDITPQTTYTRKFNIITMLFTSSLFAVIIHKIAYIIY